jgi:hypothetical protein
MNMVWKHRRADPRVRCRTLQPILTIGADRRPAARPAGRSSRPDRRPVRRAPGCAAVRLDARRLRLHRIDAHAAADAARSLERDAAADQREQGEVAAHPDVAAGLHLRPPLADQHAARRDLGARVGLHAEPLALAVPPVAG